MLITYIAIIHFFLISSKNLQYSSSLGNNLLIEENNVVCPDNCKDGLCNNETLKCDSCISGFYTDDCSKSCPRTNCFECEQDSGDCQNCDNGFILIDKFCCIEICEKCNDTGCITCKDEAKYGLNCIDCPVNCYYNNELKRKCDQDSGNCYFCISGKTGIKCDQNCNEGCDLDIKNCDMNDGTCDCKEGFYGEKCENKCDDKCEKCDSKDGTCHQCASGFYPQDKKCLKCPENCDGECPEGKCEKCKEGFYGEICNKTCSIFCKENICDKESGLCECINHFSKESYCSKCMNKYDLSTNCTKCLINYDISKECTTCINYYDISNDCTECINHFNKSSSCKECDEHYTFKSNCTKCEENYDLNQNCLKCINYFDINKNCKECLLGYYGNTCDKKCYKGCNIYKSNCERQEGYCEECYFPYYGEKCENKSEIDHCININKTSGECLKCEEKYYLINNTCEPCSSNCNNSLCEDHTGKCYSCASLNTYGEKCEKNCSKFCISFEEVTICSRENGTCYYGCNETGNFSNPQCSECTDGFYPREEGCTIPCSSNCQDICDKSSGDCKICYEGYYGEKCAEKCNEICKNSCQKEGGKCNECREGTYRDETSITGCTECPLNCTKCRNETYCEACYEGYFGHNCQEVCSQNCQDHICDINGNCPCVKNFYGEKCSLNCDGCSSGGCYDENGICTEHYCSEKFYDPRMCNKSCGDCGGEGSCDLFTGECRSCEEQKWGTDCEKKCSDECDNDGRVDCCYVKHNPKQEGIHIDFIEHKKNKKNLAEEQDEFYLFKINLGGFDDLVILADFETNSPLVIFDANTEIKKTETDIYNMNIETKYNSSKSNFYIEDRTSDAFYGYDGFSLIKEKLVQDRLILKNYTFNNFSFLICQEYKLEKEFDNAGKINGIVGLGLRNYFTEALFWDMNNTLPKNIVIRSINENKKNSLYIGDYNNDIKKSFSKLSTMEITNKKDITMNTTISFKTEFNGIAYSLRKAYKYQYDKEVILNNRIETTIVFNNLYKQFFEKIYFGDLFENGCYFRSLQGGEGEYYCDKNKGHEIQNLPKFGLILGNYIYYLSYQFLFKESGQFITFIIKLHGQGQQKIELGKSFFNEFSVVYNNGNETLNFFGDIKKLNVPLRDPSNLLNIDSDYLTPGGWVTVIVFLTALLIIICYLTKYCWSKNDDDNSDDDEIEEDDDEPLIDDTLE